MQELQIPFRLNFSSGIFDLKARLRLFQLFEINNEGLSAVVNIV
jgi:hypothetical protein